MPGRWFTTEALAAGLAFDVTKARLTLADMDLRALRDMKKRWPESFSMMPFQKLDIEEITMDIGLVPELLFWWRRPLILLRGLLGDTSLRFRLARAGERGAITMKMVIRRGPPEVTLAAPLVTPQPLEPLLRSPK